jgi:hypothetical protein
MKILKGKVSWFGGAKDTGMSATETLALYQKVNHNDMDLPYYNKFYCAMRWDYQKIATNLNLSINEAINKLRNTLIWIEFNNLIISLVPVDWGPAQTTGRLIDISPKAMELLQCKTDDIVNVIMPDWVEVK